MVLINSWAIYLGIPVIICLLILKFRKSNIYKTGIKAANTAYTKELPRYKNLIKRYRILVYSLRGLCLAGIFLAFFLLARPARSETNESLLYNRDIFLCMDVSGSVNEVNKEVVKDLKKIVNGLHGERFGISIFNTSSVLLVPLTDDYDYVNDVLDTLSASFVLNDEYEFGDYEEGGGLYLLYYISDGTLMGNELRGSSIIGDGLASCVFSFANLDEKRTRIIIFTTDNELEGDEQVTLQEAAEIAHSRNIIVYGIAPASIGSPCDTPEHGPETHINAEPEFRKAVRTTGGELYVESSENTVSSIINNIERQQRTFIQGQKETRKIDQPLVPFMILSAAIMALFALGKKAEV